MGTVPMARSPRSIEEHEEQPEVIMKSKIRSMSAAALAIAIGMAFATQAQDSARNARAQAGDVQSAAAREAQRKELESAREDLQRAARRLAELSRSEEMAAMRQRIERRPMLGVLLAPDARTGVPGQRRGAGRPALRRSAAEDQRQGDRGWHAGTAPGKRTRCAVEPEGGRAGEDLVPARRRCP
jgi:hypothetical protein